MSQWLFSTWVYHSLSCHFMDAAWMKIVESLFLFSILFLFIFLIKKPYDSQIQPFEQFAIRFLFLEQWLDLLNCVSAYWEVKNKFQSKMFANEAVWAQFQFCSICILFLASYKASLYLDGCLNDLYDNAVAFSYHGCFYGRLSSLSWHRGEEGTFCHFFPCILTVEHASLFFHMALL